MTTMTSLTISHADYSNIASFARVCQNAFADADASILPNRAVMAACLAQGVTRRGNKPVEVAMIGNDATRTAYRVGGELGLLVVIDVLDGDTETLDLGASDEDSEAACAAMLAIF